MMEKTVRFDGMDVHIQRTADGNITAEPVAPQNMDELVEAVRAVCHDACEVRNEHDLVAVECKYLYTRTLCDIKELGLSLSFIADDKCLFVHDELGDTEYTYAYGADGSEQ